MREFDKSIQLLSDYDTTTMMKGLAMGCVFFHHWLGWLPHQSGSLFELLNKGGGFAGTFVNVFFILSGYGLMKSIQKKPIDNWRKWYIHRSIALLIPYWFITVATFFFARWSLWFFDSSETNLPWSTLLLHLFLLRNFFSGSWGFNDSLWFIPVIFGLYLFFPLLLCAIKKGVSVFVFFSSFVGIGSVLLFSFMGFPTGHFGAFFAFYTIPFSLGMLLAHKDISLRYFGRIKWVVVAFALYLSSFMLIKFCHALGDYNDILNAFGAMIICSWLCRIIAPIRVAKIIVLFFGKNSYALYLLHGVCILHLAKPLLQEVNLNPFEFMLTGGLLLSFLVLVTPWISTLIWGAWNWVVCANQNNDIG